MSFLILIKLEENKKEIFKTSKKPSKLKILSINVRIHKIYCNYGVICGILDMLATNNSTYSQI